MTGIDILTRDVAGTRNGVAIAAYAFEQWGNDYPVSGDEIARMKAEEREK